MNSNLIINSVRVDRSHYEFNPQSEILKDTQHDLEVNYGVELMINETDFKDGLIFLSCSINKNKPIDEVPFMLDVHLVGFFEVKEGELKDYIVSCISMLLPYVRAHISTLTAISGIPTVILPAINVYQLIKDLNQQKEMKM